MDFLSPSNQNLQPDPSPILSHPVPSSHWHALSGLTQVNVSEALGSNGVRCVLIYTLQAQASQLGLIEEPCLERVEVSTITTRTASLPNRGLWVSDTLPQGG